MSGFASSMQSSSQPRDPPSSQPGTQSDQSSLPTRSHRAKELPDFEKKCASLEAENPELAVENPAGSGWTEVSSILRKHDEDMVKAHNENIDTLLVFAGLFSAILTAFIIEAYRLLQQDPTELSVQILLQISMQLRSLSVTPDFINSTFVPSPPASFSPIISSTWINALWFSSLVLSLITASLGILVKQWLREYLANKYVSPKQYCAVRLFRIRGLRFYRVSEIASLLPLLLQLALVLFLIGLVLFIRSIHPSIASCVIALVTAWISFVLGTSGISLFSPSCPYKTPLLKSSFTRLRHILRILYTGLVITFLSPLYWRSSSDLFVEEPIGSISPVTEAEVLADLHDTIRDVNSWEVAMRCIDLNAPLRSLGLLTNLVKQKTGSSSRPGSRFDHGELRVLLKNMIACLRRSYLSARSRTFGKMIGVEEMNALSLLRRLCHDFVRYSDMDAALVKIPEFLLDDANFWSTPALPCGLHSFIVKWLGLPSGNPFANIEPDVLTRVIGRTNAVLDSTYGCKIPPSNVLELCRILFHCAAQATPESHQILLTDFHALIGRLASVLHGFPSSTDCHWSEVFACQCTLDMAMRLFERIPGVIDRALFEEMHRHSLRLFDMDLMNDPLVSTHLRGWGQSFHAPAQEQIGNTDWERVFVGDEHESVNIRGVWEYGDDCWDYNMSRISCKHRIEFILNYYVFPEPRYFRDLRSMFSRFQF